MNSEELTRPQAGSTIMPAAVFTRLQKYPALVVCMLVFIASTTVVMMLRNSISIGHNVLISEDSLVEKASAALWFAAALILLGRAVVQSRFRMTFFALAYLFAIFSARELDLHRRLFDWNLTKIPNYARSSVPILERSLVFAVLIIPSVLSVTWLVAKWWRRWREAGSRGDAWAGNVAFWIAGVVIALSLDKVSTLLGFAGIRLDYDYPLRAVEETLELALALFSFLLAAGSGVRSENSGGAQVG